jgi:hypothetical protein
MRNLERLGVAKGGVYMEDVGVLRRCKGAPERAVDRGRERNERMHAAAK